MDLTPWLMNGLLLVLASPWIGLATLWIARRRSLAEQRQLLLANVCWTALLATVVSGVAVAMERQSPTWQGTELRLPLVNLPTVTRQPWRVQASIGVDRVNRGPLCWLPWLAVAAVLTTRAGLGESPGRYQGLLALEAAFLLTAAAGDGFTFLAGLSAATLVGLALSAAWGHETRREATWQLSVTWILGDGLIACGLFALAAAALWSRQELSSTLPPFDLSWRTLSITLPTNIRQSESAAAYWSTAAGWSWCPLVLGLLMKAGLPPFHAGTMAWQRATATPVAILLGAGGLPVTFTLWVRVVRPVFGPDLAGWSEPLAVLGAVTALCGGLLALSQTTVRGVTLSWLAAWQGFVWLVASAGTAASAATAWELSVLAGLCGALWRTAVIEETGSFEPHPAESLPRAQRWRALVTTGLMLGLPLGLRGRLDWQAAWAIATQRPGPFFVAALGLFLAAWGALWMLAGCFQPQTQPAGRTVDVGSSTAADESTRRAWGLLAILWVLIVLGVWPLPRGTTP
jgi:formate hydrogenlyase subunit 3/multisubunit Na+/H+ antiporter MnhD subunit